MKYTQALLTLVVLLLLSLEAKALPRFITLQWEYPEIENIAGFRLYRENNQVCSTNLPQATSLECSIDVPDGTTWFTLTAVFEDGTESAHSEPLTYVFTSDLKAQFTADILEGESPLSVTFDAGLSGGNISTYEWMFGDGDFSIGSSVANHTFFAAGAYIVTLKITDSAGAVDQDSLTILVTSPSSINKPPTAVISSSTTVGRAPLPVDFDGTRSSDSDGTILSFSWKLGDGTSAGGKQISHTFVVAGTFTTSLKVTDDGGLSDSVSTPVIVQPQAGSNIPPTAIINASAKSGKIPLSLLFNGNKSMDTDGSITEYTWNFGDGTAASGMTIRHSFLKAGEYKVTLKVTDNLGAVSLPAVYTVTATSTDTEEEDIGKGVTPSILRLLLRQSEEKQQP
jgi:PKD repeat protein